MLVANPKLKSFCEKIVGPVLSLTSTVHIGGWCHIETDNWQKSGVAKVTKISMVRILFSIHHHSIGVSFISIMILSWPELKDRNQNRVRAYLLVFRRSSLFFRLDPFFASTICFFTL